MDIFDEWLKWSNYLIGWNKLLGKYGWKRTDDLTFWNELFEIIEIAIIFDIVKMVRMGKPNQIYYLTILTYQKELAGWPWKLLQPCGVATLIWYFSRCYDI